MFKTISYEDTLNKKSKIYIDCRTSYEFNESTIPNAINIPILLEEERIQIGTLYVKGKIEEAKIKGVTAVSKRLPDIFSQIIKLKKEYANLYFFCARGGYRSSAIANMLVGVGVDCYKLTGGYKGYRKYVNDNMDNLIDNVEFITLYGYTGTGKTSILNALENMGCGILNLEKYANHRGSLLGSIGKTKANSQKTFESLLFEDLSKNKGKYVFVEGESRRIGNIVMSNKLYEKLRSSKKILIKSPIEFRINEIKNQYLTDFNSDKELIKNSIMKLERYISKDRIQRYIENVTNDEYDIVIQDLCENYYDINYKLPRDIFEKEYMNTNSIDTANQIIEDYRDLFLV